MKENINQNPFIAPELGEIKIVQKYWTDLFHIVSLERPELNETLIYDLILRAIRKLICETINCNGCRTCNPSTFMTEKHIKSQLENNKQSILDLIKWGLNNSYNIPERWVIFLSVFDEIFHWSENIIVCEIWCWGWLIWTVLANSNYSRNYFKEWYSHVIKKEKDDFLIQYYWLDPNLLKCKKDILMNINWSTEYAQNERKKIERFFNDNKFKNNNILLEENVLSEDTISWIKKNILSMLRQNPNYKKEFVVISSVVRYHFRNPSDDNYFVQMIEKLLYEVYNETGIQWYYISKEIYWDDGKIYPSNNEIPSKFLVNYSIIWKDWVLSEKKNIPRLSHNLF